MKVTFANNTLTVVTDLTKEVIDKGIGSTKVTDDKGNHVYAFGMSKSTDASITTFGIACNTFIDDKAAAVVVYPIDTKLADVQKDLGDALIAANKYIPQIVEAATQKATTIAALFTAAE